MPLWVILAPECHTQGRPLAEEVQTLPIGSLGFKALSDLWQAAARRGGGPVFLRRLYEADA